MEEAAAAASAQRSSADVSPDAVGGEAQRQPQQRRQRQLQQDEDEEWKPAAPAPAPTRPQLTCQSSEEREEHRGCRPHPLYRADSLSEGDSDQGGSGGGGRRHTASPAPFPADMSDSDGARPRSPLPPRRYSKRPLRGPYGQMLEAEMQKPEPRIHSKFHCSEDLKFLEELAAPASPGPSRAATVQSLDEAQLQRPRPTTAAAPAAAAPAAAPPLHSPSPSASPVPRPATQPATGARRKVSGGPPPCHQRTASSPSQLEGCQRRRHHALADLLADGQDRIFVPPQQFKDTRTHVAVEILETERSYVESLHVLVFKYLKQLKSPENAGLVDSALVDEIFYQIPAILSHHEVFLAELQKKLDDWDQQQTIGDVFVEAFTKQHVIDMYTSFINNWKSAKEAVKSTCQAKPAFAKFLETMAREHKGKLALDSLLIMPVQRIPRYELLLQTLIKNTEQNHPDYNLLLSAQREVHVLAVKINCTERESVEAEQQQALLRELENVIEGCSNIFTPDRVFLRFDLVSVTGDAAGSGNPERGLFLFNDLLIITTVKRRSGAIRKPSAILPANLIQQLEGNKHRMAMRLLLEDVEIVKLKDDILRDLVREVENLAEDAVLLTQIGEIAARMHTDHTLLDDIIREMLCYVNKQLSEHNGSESKLSHIEFIISSEGAATDSLVVVFSSQDKKSDWEEVFNDAKQKLALSAERRGSPEFVLPLPIRKTRAGLQFTCAAPTLGTDARDVWVCNSDGYVGQVCVLSLSPEPTVVSCNGVCNARILCIASVPAIDSGHSDYGFGHSNFFNSKSGISISVEDTDEGNLPYDSSSSDGDYETEDCVGADEELKNNTMEPVSITATPSEVSVATVPGSEDSDSMQPTMWLGTEDGCIHVYNCTDNIRIKKNKVKIQHGSSVHCIIYLDNRVFVSLANGDITVYTRDSNGGWNTTDPLTVGVGTAAMPVTRMLSIGGKLWCGCHNTIKILNTVSLNIEHSFQVNSDSSRSVTCLALAGFGVWISLQNSAVVKLFHAITYECLCDVNVAPAVTKMLQSCDDIIRQHKAACLRVTSLLACKDMLWIGTSAGVILNMRLPHVTPSTTKVTTVPTASGMPHGHTGHVRFLTCVETGCQHVTKESLKQHSGMFVRQVGRSRSEGNSSKSTLLVISGGDGYEDFRTSGVSEVAGREDSTNHLLLWLV